MDDPTTSAGAFCRRTRPGGSSRHKTRRRRRRRGVDFPAAAFRWAARRGGSAPHHHARRRCQRRCVNFPAAALCWGTGASLGRRSASSRRPQLGRPRRIHCSRHPRQTDGRWRRRAVERDAEAGRHAPQQLMPRERASWRRRRRRHGDRAARSASDLSSWQLARWLKLSVMERSVSWSCSTTDESMIPPRWIPCTDGCAEASFDACSGWSSSTFIQ
jgi:hypothetical protein